MRRNIFILILLLTVSFLGFSQGDQPVPTDPNVIIGKLDNGLTYYIRQNKLPENRADFYIAQNVGSILEEDSQAGLAHFLEHMAFNGTTNFPGKALINYLETIGVKFGENLNAGTGFDQTIYNISNVPVTRQGIIDSCLLILHDWSSFISLEDQEIDNERGVIREEWRSRSNANIRMIESMLPIIYPNSQYAKRMPIGSIDIINTFPYQVLKDYYDKWYRPDLQAIIVVGDIDPKAIEAKIKTMFADIQPNENPAERIQYDVPDNQEPIVAIVTDPEAQHTTVTVYQKHDAYPEEAKGFMSYYVQQYAVNITNMMLNNRFEEIAQKPGAPFTYAFAFDDDYLVSRTKDAFTVIAGSKEGESAQTLEAILTEMEKIEKFGFTASEYERAKADMLTSIESEYNEREKQKNEYYVNQYVANFTDSEPIPGIEFEYQLYNMIIPNIPIEAINQMVMNPSGTENMIVTITGPKKEGVAYPTDSEVMGIINNIQNKELTAYEDNAINEPLIAKMPKKGKIKKTEQLPQFGATEWVLSNGARVVYKKTDFKDNEIIFGATSKGGMSLVPDADLITLKAINDLIGIGGYGNFDKISLDKALAGKKVNLHTQIGTYNEGFYGMTTPKDLTTFMQLLYLSITSPRMDQDAFQAYLQRTGAALKNRDNNPMNAFSDSITSILMGNHPRAIKLKYADLEKINYNRAIEIYKERFANAGDFVFYFVGNVDENVLKPLVEQYIASLPAKKGTETWKDINVRYAEGNVKRHYEKELETPKATVALFYSGKTEVNNENRIKLSILTDVLDIVFTEKVREDEGGTYGVSVFGNMTQRPIPQYLMQIVFETDPQMADKLIGIIRNEISNIAQNGPREADLNKVKENSLKKFKEEMAENNYWEEVLDTYYDVNENMIENYEKTVQGISVQSLKEFANNLLKNANVKEIVQSGKQK